MCVYASKRCASIVLALCSMLLCGVQAGAQVFVDNFNDNYIDPDIWGSPSTVRAPRLQK